MPIARINPDGTVKIYNSKTKEMKDVPPEQLGAYNPKLIADYEAMVKESTPKPTEQVANVKAQKELLDITSGKMPAKELTEGERTDQGLGRSGLEALKTVEEMYGEDENVLMKQLIPQQPMSRTFDSALFNTVDSLLRIRSGATAPPEEVRSYMKKLGPSYGDTKEDAKFKLKQLRQALITEGGVPEEEVNKYLPKTEGKAMEMARQRAKGFQGKSAVEKLGDWWNELNKQAENMYVKDDQGFVTEKNPIWGNQQKMFKPEVGNQLQDLVLGASGGGGAAQVTTKQLAKIPKALQGLFSLNKIGQGRDAAVEAAKEIMFSGDDIAKAGAEYVSRDPMAKNVANKILPNIQGKQLSTPDLMKFIDVWNDAYTSLGKVGKSAEAGLNDVLAKKAKELIAKEAPDVAKSNKQFKRAYALRDTARKVLPTAAAGVGLGVGGDVLSRWLFGDK